MRRIGIILVVLGMAGFLIASSQRGSYKSVEGVLKTTFSKEERGKSDLADTGRWVGLGVAVLGVVLILLPQQKS
jgi:hypothetical protein